jgi:hypothetical protein
LQTLGEGFHNARELADADHAVAWHVTHPGTAQDRSHMVFAMAFEADATQHDHLIIAFDLVKRLLKDRGGIVSVAYERLFECARYPSRGLD